MAKTGYRGKHPYDDMNISKHSGSGGKLNHKYFKKLKEEYDRLGTKHKYSFIRSNQGFFPQATANVGPFTTDVLNNQTVTLISTDGTSKVYTAKDAGETLTSRFFASDGDADAHATSFANCVNHADGHNGKIIAVANGANVTLTQADCGPDGNTTITETLHANVNNISATFTGG